MSKVNTVLGEVDVDRLGLTLMHEHIFANLLTERRPEGLLNDFQLMKHELSEFKAAGGSTIVDLTTAEITFGASTDPLSHRPMEDTPGDSVAGSRSVANVLDLKRMAEETGLNIVIGTGHYRDPFMTSGWFEQAGTNGVARQIIRDIEVGIADTGVKAGIIGEIGADKWFVSSVEERSFRAAARAHLATGVAISTHAAKWPVGAQQLDILAEEGVDPRRVIVGHCDTVPLPDYHVALAARGAYVQFDNIRRTSEYDLQLQVSFITNLISRGYLDRILLSQDVCKRYHLNIAGGGGFTYVITDFKERLEDAGVAEDDIHHILVDNPKRALAGET